MSGVKIYEGENGLVKTTVYGMEQEAFVVTEDQVSNFNNYSFEFQVCLTLWSVSLGVFFANLGALWGVVFTSSLVATLLLSFFLFWSWKKFEKVKKSLFVKSSELLKTNAEKSI